MIAPFGRWNERIRKAAEENAQRELIRELSLWRAGRLADVPAQRDTAYALSVLYGQIGELDTAVAEGRSFLSLCRTAPAVSGDHLKFAMRHVSSLEKGVVADPHDLMRAQPAQPAAPRKQREEPQSGPLDEAWQKVVAGDFDGGAAMARGRRGAASRIFRLWVDLAHAMSLEGADREQALTGMEGRLRDQFAPQTAAGAKPIKASRERAEEPIEPPESEFGRLLGRRVPRRREAMLRLLDAHVAGLDAEGIDIAAAAALEHHVSVQGLKRAAPWLTTIVGRALIAGEGSKTLAMIETLSEQGAFCVTAYAEEPFGSLVSIARELPFGVTALRRGVVRTTPMKDHRLWTLRLVQDAAEIMVAVAPAVESWPDGFADEVAVRLVELCPQVILVAEGDAHEGLRSAAERAGVVVVTVAGIADAVPSLMEAAAEFAASRPEPEPEPARETAAAVSSDSPRPVREKRERKRDNDDEVVGLIAAALADGADAEALAPLVSQLARSFKAFTAVRDAVQGDPAGADAQLSALMIATHGSAPEHVRLSEAASLALQVAARVPEGNVAAILADDGALGARYAGPGWRTVVDVVGGVAPPWEVDRVLRGVTRREKRRRPELDALSGAAEGLWRVLISSGETRDEIWALSELNAEGQALVAQMVPEMNPNAVVVCDAVLQDWFAGLKGPAVTAVGDLGEGLARLGSGG